jgi:hypothetical protein
MILFLEERKRETGKETERDRETEIEIYIPEATSDISSQIPSVAFFSHVYVSSI